MAPRQVGDAVGGDQHGEATVVVAVVVVVGLGERLEGQVVGEVGAPDAGDLDAQAEAVAVVLGGPELEDLLVGPIGDGDDPIGRRSRYSVFEGEGGVGHRPARLPAMPDDAPSAPTGPDVLYEVDGHVATLTLNRPHRRNAISVRMLGC